jgi:hypothetical protein
MSVLNNNTNMVLHKFANKLWNTMVEMKVNDNVKTLYFQSVNKLLNSVTKKPKIPIPFYGFVNKDWCCGIKKNHGLYTQCPKQRPNDKKYCEVCMKQVKNNANRKPNCGVINERLEQWNTELDYKPPGMKREVPYANILIKLEIDIEDAQAEVEKMGWPEIPLCHLTEKKVRRGRPKSILSVSEEPKQRGRPRKVILGERTDDELIADFMSQYN